VLAQYALSAMGGSCCELSGPAGGKSSGVGRNGFTGSRSRNHGLRQVFDDLGNKAGNRFDHAGHIGAGANPRHRAQHRGDFFGVRTIAGPCSHAWHRGRVQPLDVVGQFLVKLFARTLAGELDPHAGGGAGFLTLGGFVDDRPEPVGLDEAPSQVHDADRLAHVEHEDFLTLMGVRANECGRLDHEGRGFGDRHEVAGHPRIGHRDGAALGDLLGPDRQDAARGAQHIAEADETEAGSALALVE